MNPITEYILFGISIGGSLIAMYRSVREPDEKADKSISLLAQQLAEIRTNHLHTLDVRVNGLDTKVNDLSIHIAKLTTIIDERIPKKP